MSYLSDNKSGLYNSTAIIPSTEGVSIPVGLTKNIVWGKTNSILLSLQEELAQNVVDEPFWDVERKKDYLATLTRILEIHEECFDRLIKGEEYPRELTEEWEKMAKKLARLQGRNYMDFTWFKLFETYTDIDSFVGFVEEFNIEGADTETWLASKQDILKREVDEQMEKLRAYLQPNSRAYEIDYRYILRLLEKCTFDTTDIRFEIDTLKGTWWKRKMRGLEYFMRAPEPVRADSAMKVSITGEIAFGAIIKAQEEGIDCSEWIELLTTKYAKNISAHVRRKMESLEATSRFQRKGFDPFFEGRCDEIQRDIELLEKLTIISANVAKTLKRELTKFREKNIDRVTKPKDYGVIHLDEEGAAQLKAIEEAPDDADFVELWKLTWLDPKTSYRWGDFSGVDFINNDLSEFDFTWSVLKGCVFINTTLPFNKLSRHQLKNSCFVNCTLSNGIAIADSEGADLQELLKKLESSDDTESQKRAEKIRAAL